MPSAMQADSASSIGPPIRKNRSFTPCAFRHRARMSLPVSSAIAFPPPFLSFRRGPESTLQPIEELPGGFPACAGMTKQLCENESGAHWAPLHFLSSLPEDFFGPQLLDFAAAEAEPAGEHILGMLPQLRRRLQLGRLAVEADRPGLAHPVAVRVVHRLHDAAILEALVVLQFEGVVDGPSRHPGGADDLHRLFLGVLA